MAMIAAGLLLGCSQQEKVVTPSKNDLQEIQARGKLIVGVNSHLPGMSFYNPSFNHVDGFEPDIARQIAKEIFGDEKDIEFVVTLPEDRTKFLESRKIDLAINELSINNKSIAQFGLSEPYYHAIETLMVKKDSPIKKVDDLANKTVALVADTSSAVNIPKLVPTAKTIIVSNLADGLEALKYGQADALASPYVLLKIIRTLIPEPQNYVILEGFYATEDWVVGTRKNQPELLEEVNKTLQKIKADGTWQSIYDKNIKSITGQTVLPP
jgi:ABC-type amino acid transport substrate-binding protein